LNSALCSHPHPLKAGDSRAEGLGRPPHFGVVHHTTK
jgi:hypothetical protein